MKKLHHCRVRVVKGAGENEASPSSDERLQRLCTVRSECVAIHQPYGQVESISGATLLPFLSSTFRDIDLSYLSYISRNVILVWLSI
jgi:hypothetical protein